MIRNVLFDLGKVLLDWDPRHYYARHFDGDAAALERFVHEAIPGTWIAEMDRGKPVAQAMAERQRLCPEHAELIGRWAEGWPQMLRGEIEGTVRILEALEALGYPLYALTNFSTETWPIARARCPVLGRFRHIVISAEVGCVKPEPAIYRIAIERCAIEPGETLFIDDLAANVEAGRAAGFQALRYRSPAELAADLGRLGIELAGC